MKIPIIKVKQNIWTIHYIIFCFFLKSSNFPLRYFNVIHITPFVTGTFHIPITYLALQFFKKKKTKQTTFNNCLYIRYKPINQTLKAHVRLKNVGGAKFEFKFL